MKNRRLGYSDLYVAPLTLGGNVFGWTIDERKSFEILDAFVAAGFNLIDTADVYSRWAPGNTGGESETIIGNWTKSRNNRKDVIIATKVGADMGPGKRNLSKPYILKAIDESLRRLQTDYIDLYQTHWDDITTPVEETLETYSELVKSGKVRWIGASNLSPERLLASIEASKAHNYPAYQTLQPEYNLYERAVFEKDYEKIALDNNLSVINYYALASGFLTGKYRSEDDLSKSARGGDVKKYLNDRGYGILEALDEVSERYTTTPASVSIAWLLARPGVAAPIASATSIDQLNALVEAASLELDDEAIAALTTASDWK
jgi:aryl-alcohol dehydrogenase-like predicted oxidoreductase